MSDKGIPDTFFRVTMNPNYFHNSKKKLLCILLPKLIFFVNYGEDCWHFSMNQGYIKTMTQVDLIFTPFTYGKGECSSPETSLMKQ